MKPQIRVFPNPEALADQVAADFYDLLLVQQLRAGRIHLCLTGGRVSTMVLQAIQNRSAGSGIIWDRTDWWWGDERYLLRSSPQRNEAQARVTLLDSLPIRQNQIHPMPATDDLDGDIDRAADQYTHEVQQMVVDGFDLVFLSIGEDGHIASLFPGQPQSDSIRTAALSIRNSPKPPPDRISLTIPMLTRTRNLWLLAAGDQKAKAVAEVLQNPDCDLPAARVLDLGESILYLDEGAAGQIDA